MRFKDLNPQTLTLTLTQFDRAVVPKALSVISTLTLTQFDRAVVHKAQPVISTLTLTQFDREVVPEGRCDGRGM
jgi:hypothetical protein